jgi:putative transposase
VIKLGRNMNNGPRQSSRKCTKLYREGKLWKLKKYRRQDRQMFKNTLNNISWQIVSFADSLCSGIKLEKLFSDRYPQVSRKRAQSEFSFGNGSFIALQRLVEKRARDRGIPVLYVNPAFTSKRCCRCGGSGRRVRKRFECPCCGSVIHADVNAAFNIALTSNHLPPPFKEYRHNSGKRVRKMIRFFGTPADAQPMSHCIPLWGEEILSFLE